jgi:acetyltransferase-like isoleucine patch superfamily enzyme
MMEAGLLKGEFSASKVGGLPPSFFWDRQTWLGCRGDPRICPQNVTLGFGVKIITCSHDFLKGEVGPSIPKKVWIDQHVFVGSFAILYNCHLMHNSVVACGSVVRNITVPPYTMVEGNPARPVRQYKDGSWKRI